jgi:hypothetical protein
MTWLQKNISKRKNDFQAMLGWTCGSDSARWSSINLKDYEETIKLFIPKGRILLNKQIMHSIY